MDISVIIPTYNRSSQLRRTLTSFLQVDIPGNIEYELIVVDNNSSDATAEVVHSLCESGERNIRYVFEPKQGVSNARNKGFEEAKGNIIACADDDIEFDPGWIIDILRAFEGNPDVSAVTGKVQPVFENGRPDWLEDEYLVVYGLQDYGESSVALKFPIVPIEMNVAFRQEAIQAVGGYDPGLGRDGKTLLSGEANLFFYLLDRYNAKTLYVPDMKLYHIIPPNRVTHEWLVSRYYWSAISQIKSRQLTMPYSVGELRSGFVVETIALVKALTGNNLSPRKLYWHRRTFSIRNRTAVAWHFGSAKQLLRELLCALLSRSKLPCMP